MCHCHYREHMCTSMLIRPKVTICSRIHSEFCLEFAWNTALRSRFGYEASTAGLAGLALFNPSNLISHLNSITAKYTVLHTQDSNGILPIYYYSALLVTNYTYIYRLCTPSSSIGRRFIVRSHITASSISFGVGGHDT